MGATSADRRGLEERLAAGETILCAEGYLLALSRMGYIAHGVWVPEFILEQPEVLKMVHRMFVHSGTDVTEAYQVRLLQCRQLHDSGKNIFYSNSTVLHTSQADEDDWS